MIVNLANLSRSCLRPTFSNSTVILQLSPVSSMAVTVPFPKRAWQMSVPISTCPAAVATVDCVVEWVSPVGLESILVNRLPGDGATNGLGAGVRSVFSSFHREVLRGLSVSNGNRFHDMVSLGDSCLVCTGISTYRESRSLMNRLGGEETVCPLR